MLEIGKTIPNVEVKTDQGETKMLYDLIKQKCILFFYPKDMTAGCTKEACSINDYYDKLIQLGYQIIGISPQNEKSKSRFKEKYQLKMNFLCDEEHTLCEAFGVWQEKKLYGKTYMGVVRTTFICDENKTITQIINKVKTATHGEDLYEILK